jgi:phage terminase large subunit-like protein
LKSRLRLEGIKAAMLHELLSKDAMNDPHQLAAAIKALPVKLVHASRGKVARAEPIAALYAAGRVRHCGLFARLEDQLCGLLVGGAFAGPGRSPDRADALVWALTELMLGKTMRPSVTSL